jgi:hypothetical protein
MATYYVAKTGNDSTGDGSSGSPWKTLNKAIATVPAGTAGSPNVIILKNGNYNMTAGEGISASVQSVDITKANLIVKAETRKGVVLRGDWGPALRRTIWAGRTRRPRRRSAPGPTRSWRSRSETRTRTARIRPGNRRR